MAKQTKPKVVYKGMAYNLHNGWTEYSLVKHPDGKYSYVNGKSYGNKKPKIIK